MIDRYTPVTRERNASQPNTNASSPGAEHDHQHREPELIEAVPVPGQLVPVQEHHEVRQLGIAVDAACTDLAHQVHAHRVAAEREERAVAQAQDAGVAPDEIERDREQRVAEVLAEQLHR